jgi:hypothetical protein
MRAFRRFIFALTAMAALGLSLRAQPAPDGATNHVAKSPVAIFRELLTMSPQERRDAIAIRPPDIQKRILEKLNEYEILPDELRELRLRETELRWYLRPLMDGPRTNRAAALAKIPEALRLEIEGRLKTWDIMPPDLQQQFKDNDFIASVQAGTPEQRSELLSQIPSDRRDELKMGFDRWQKMSDADRRTALASFNKFFELTPDQKEEMLDTLSDDEREQMKKTLSSYANLSPAQREQCISAFEKFARMSVAQRQQFLKNAEHWREMTPEERQKWRDLVSVAPIMPSPAAPQPASTNRSLLRDGSTAIAGN